MRKGSRMKVFLLRRRYLFLGLTLLLAAALYLCEQVGPAFPAVRSSLGTACVQKW